ncbi:MAG: glycosyltransferase family 39 protein [Flavobacterium sp.]|uniref:glycosyltransferase family 39 protein n=1 Tax=Flavobacterium sp. TaxID=239 RepID=UPI00326476A0
MKKNYLSFLHQHLGFFLFLIMLLIGLLTFDSYGISWDESVSRTNGVISATYAFSDDNRLLTWKDRDYGVAFEIPLVVLEKTFNLTDSRSIYLMRHLVTHLFFLLSCFYLFLLIDYLYKNKLLATVGFFLLILNPAIYAHSFFNTKDIPFLSMFIICFYYFVKAFDKKTLLSFIKLGLCAGLLINIRIMGILIVLAALLILILDIFKAQEKQKQLKLLIVFVITTFLTLYISWPFLWNNPLNNFAYAFENMSNFRWESSVLFNGELIKATDLSWNYIPTWFTITTPIVYLVLGTFGFLLLLFHFFKTPSAFLENSIQRTNLIFLGFFVAPLVAVILFHSVLYDGWRQMYFIYPSFILLAIYGLSHLFRKNNKTFIVSLGFLIITFMFTSIYMIRNFPLQGVYFNEAFSFSSPEYLRKNYEMDYWGVSYKQSLEYILKVDSSTSIDIAVENDPGIYNLHILPPSERKRIKIVPRENATYFITNYRWHPQDYSEYADFKFYSFLVGNNTVSEIFKFK